jgi:hypothetical protein
LHESAIHFSVRHLPIKVLAVARQVQLSPVVVIKLRNRTLSAVAQFFLDCAHEAAKPLARRR